jgi:hypothetical protein
MPYILRRPPRKALRTSWTSRGGPGRTIMQKMTQWQKLARHPVKAADLAVPLPMVNVAVHLWTSEVANLTRVMGGGNLFQSSQPLDLHLNSKCRNQESAGCCSQLGPTQNSLWNTIAQSNGVVILWSDSRLWPPPWLTLNYQRINSVTA